MPKRCALILLLVVLAACSAPTSPAPPTLAPSATLPPPPMPPTRASSLAPSPTLPSSGTPAPSPTSAGTATATRLPSVTPLPSLPPPNFTNLSGSKIVFSSKHINPAAELWLVDLKTSRMMRLIGNLFANNLDPRLSPDGSKVVFASNLDGNYDLFTLKVDDNTLRGFPEDLEQTLEHDDWLAKLGITRLTRTALDESSPAWSPDGKLIAYILYGNNASELYVMPAVGGSGTRLTTNLTVYEPDWSPDGQKILVEDETDGGGTDIAWIPAAGGSRRKLTSTLYLSERAPVWSPDGKQVAFCAVYDGQREIAVMNADGSSLTRLTNSPGADCNPTWSPDGKQILFSSNRNLFDNLFVMDASGANPRQLTFFNRANSSLKTAWGK